MASFLMSMEAQNLLLDLKFGRKDLLFDLFLHLIMNFRLFFSCQNVETNAQVGVLDFSGLNFSLMFLLVWAVFVQEDHLIPQISED